jgi:hypothetical protein
MLKTLPLDIMSNVRQCDEGVRNFAQTSYANHAYQVHYRGKRGYTAFQKGYAEKTYPDHFRQKVQVRSRSNRPVVFEGKIFPAPGRSAYLRS